MFHDTDVRRRLPVTLQDMFLVPEEFELPPVSLVSYIELNSSFYPRFSKEDMIKYLHYFEMDMDINLGSLSMGQKKKVFMSFALATNTSLLLMDEPTNGLDIPGKSQFRKFIASGMSDDKTIVISTHQVRDIDKVLDHVLIMDESRVLLDESTSSICEKLFFVESDDRELAQTALFAIPTIQGNFVLGSSVWPKNSFLKTFVSVTIIVLIYVLVGMLVGDMLFSGSSKDYGYIFSSITKEQVTVMVTVGFMLFAFVNWTLAYFRFKESEIIQRM